MHAISKHQSAFRISISNLHCQPFSTFDYIWRPKRIITDKVLNQAYTARQINFYLFFDYPLKSWEHSRCSALIQKHIEHSSSYIW